MQTFLPYTDFTKCASVLDRMRLGKQRVEAHQILDVLDLKKRGLKVAWMNHPAVLMWEGYETALRMYLHAIMTEWESRGYRNIKLKLPHVRRNYRIPSWMGDRAFHASHRSNLLRKNPDHYGQFGWTESPDLPYIWPVKISHSG